jgi:hypothetical protein
MPNSADVTGAAVQVRLDGPLFVALEDWRRAQPKIVPRSWALKQLLERALAGPNRRIFVMVARRPGWTAWGDELDKFEPEYDAHDDFAKSLEEGYRVIRERVAAGGSRWVPK